jgi:hypothetical protein
MPSPTVFAQYAYDMFHAAMSEKERERVQVVEGAKMSAFAPPRKWPTKIDTGFVISGVHD